MRAPNHILWSIPYYNFQSHWVYLSLFAGLTSPHITLPDRNCPHARHRFFTFIYVYILPVFKEPLLYSCLRYVNWSFSGTGTRTANSSRSIDRAANLHIGTGLGLT